MSARFKVITVRGWRIHLPVSERGNFNAPEGLSATVIDTAYNAREIKTYWSEDMLRAPATPGMRRGIDGALAAARDHARYLNRLHGAA